MRKDALDRAFVALADGTRRGVVDAAAGATPGRRTGERPGRQRAGIEPPPAHVREAELVQGGGWPRRDARARIYTLQRDVFAELRGWVDGVETLWREQLTAFAEHVGTRAGGETEVSQPAARRDGQRARRGTRAIVFDLLAREIDRWWRRGPGFGHAGEHDGALAIEPLGGGRVFERWREDGRLREFQLGAVLMWQPPKRCSVTWRDATFTPLEQRRPRSRSRSPRSAAARWSPCATAAGMPCATTIRRGAA